MTKKILVVDDDDSIREVATSSLEGIAGWQVVAANSGEGALKLASAEAPDGILLDVMLPDMDGPTVFLRLRAQAVTASIPVALLTGKVQASDRQRFEAMGVEAVLSKPFDPLRLADELAAAFGWQ